MAGGLKFGAGAAGKANAFDKSAMTEKLARRLIAAFDIQISRVEKSLMSGEPLEQDFEQIEKSARLFAALAKALDILAGLQIIQDEREVKKSDADRIRQQIKARLDRLHKNGAAKGAAGKAKR